MTAFVRDRFTWLAYFMLGYYAYLQSIMGPVVPFLRAELNLNYTVSAFHLSAFAVGMMLAGLSADRLALRWGRYGVFWFGGAGMALGAVLLSLGQTVSVTILSSFIMGYIGTWLLVMIQATLSEKHGRQSAIALTEANIVASLFATLAPLLVGLGASAALGWRAALYAGGLLWGAMGLLLSGITVPGAVPAPRAGMTPVSPAALPRAYWGYWLVVFFSVAIEWCTIFWAADFMEKVAGLSREGAATALSAFFLAVVVGRITGSRLTRSVASGRLLLLAALVALVGFPLFWLSRTPPLTIIGLFICGLGIANLFPLTLSAAVSVAPEALANTASARVSFGSGTAILVVPQVLGSAADLVGIQSAYAIILLFTLLVIAVAFYAERLAKPGQTHRTSL